MYDKAIRGDLLISVGKYEEFVREMFRQVYLLRDDFEIEIEEN